MRENSVVENGQMKPADGIRLLYNNDDVWLNCPRIFPSMKYRFLEFKKVKPLPYSGKKAIF